MKRTFLIVDDHPLYRAALAILLQKILPHDTILTTQSAEEGLRLAAVIMHPCLVLLDFNLPGLTGVEAISAFRQKCPNSVITVISASEERQEAAAALRAGALVFISKAVSLEIMQNTIARILAKELQAPEWTTTVGRLHIELDSQKMLTPRQKEILALLIQGYSNKEIGLRLMLAEVTVKVHLSAIFKILGVLNRTQAVMAAKKLGMYTTRIAELFNAA